MKKIKLVITLLVSTFSFFISSSIFGFELLKTTIGAEAAGLGCAMAATIDDPSAIFWNPAGLANIDGKDKKKQKTNIVNEADQKFSDDSFEKLFENNTVPNAEASAKIETTRSFEMQLYTSWGYLTMDRHLFMGSTAFTLFNGTFALGLLGAYAPNISGYDSFGNSTGNIGYGVYSADIGYAWEIGSVKAGLSLSGYLENLDTINYYGGGLNLGVQMTPIPILHIGAAIQNLPGVLQQSSSDPSSFRKLDTIARISLGITTPPPDSNVMLLVGLETNLDKIAQPEIYANIGIKVKFARYFYVMAGLRDNNFALGLGFNLPFLRIAYAVNQDRLQTGFQHFVDINFSF